MELDNDKLRVYDFDGRSHDITKQELESSEILDCNNWHELYVKKKWCPLEANTRWTDVWISPGEEAPNNNGWRIAFLSRYLRIRKKKIIV